MLAIVCKYIARKAHQLMSSVKFIQLEFNWSPSLLSKMVIFDDFYPPIAETCGAFMSCATNDIAVYVGSGPMGRYFRVRHG